MKHPLLFPTLLLSLAIASGCAGGGDGNDASKADSLRRDSLMRLHDDSLRRALADSLRRDSLLRDSIMADSLFEAHALRFDDFFTTSSAITFHDAATIVKHLNDKGFETIEARRLTASYDPNDPEGTDFPTVTNYRLADGPDSTATTTDISIRMSEGDRPITINFASDRQRDIFVNSLKDNGFSADHTGTLAHRSNTSWAGATATESGRRVILEWIWSY